MRRYQSLLITALSISIYGCGGGGGGFSLSSTSSQPAAGSASSVSDAISKAQAQGTMPVLNTDTTVLGTDSDNNGVRDDIDAYISGLPDTSQQKAALLQDARAIQSSLSVDITNPSAVKSVSNAIAASVACLHSSYSVGTASQKGKDIQKLTVNTVNRLNSYEKFNAALSGTSIKLTAGVGCAQ